MNMNRLESGLRNYLALLVVFLASFTTHAATLAISPSAIGNEFRGVVTLQIGALTNGETVVIKKYADLNGNGIIDGGDLLMENFQITDGFVTTIGGATNLNIPYDSTGTNGAITTSLNFFENDSIRHIIGNYLFRLSGPGGAFTPVTNSFAVTNSPHAQKIMGVVRSGSTNLPGAIIVLLTPRPDQNLVAGTMTDTSGNYSLSLPPGTYQMLGFKSGYAGDFSTSAAAVLGTNATLTTNVDLIVASRIIVGSVVNAANTNVGPPGVFLFAQSSGGWYGSSTTGTNGTFSLPVTPDTWQIQPQSEDLAQHGYVSLQGWPGFDTTAGSISNALITAPYGTAMFYGSARDDTNAPLAGIQLGADDNSSQYEAGGESDISGNYCVAVVPGAWNLSVNNNNPALAGYVVAGGTNASILSGQAIRSDFVVRRTTGTIRGYVKDNTGTAVNGVSIYSFASIGGTNFNAGANTDTNGNYSLNVIDGVWTVGLSCDGNDGLPRFGYNCVGQQTIAVPPANAVANFTVYPYGTPSFGNPFRPGDSQFMFQFFGAPGTNYTVQASTNMSFWFTLVVTNPPDYMIFIQDNQATNSRRFYRAFTGP